MPSLFKIKIKFVSIFAWNRLWKLRAVTDLTIQKYFMASGRDLKNLI